MADKTGPGRDTAMSAALYGLKNEHLDDLAHLLANFRNQGPPTIVPR